MTYNTSIQVYSATDSLLLRRIQVNLPQPDSSNDAPVVTIVATRLSKQIPDHVWIALSDGHIYLVDWKKDTITSNGFQTTSKTAKSLVLVPTKFPGAIQEAIVVGESTKPSLVELVAYQWESRSEPTSKTLMSLTKAWGPVHLLEASADGQILAGSLNERLYFAKMSSQEVQSIEQLEYECFSLDSPDIITAIDLRVFTKRRSGKKGQSEAGVVVDIILGGARGGIYLYHDAISRFTGGGKSSASQDEVEVRKYHWHRKAVHALKWSRDGMYIVFFIRCKHANSYIR